MIELREHREIKIPASIRISVEAGKWHVSGAFDDARVQPSEEEIAAWLATFSQEDLLAATVGVDRGVAIPACASNGRTFDFSDVQKERMAKKEASARKWQRRMARRKKGSSNRRKARTRVAACKGYARRVRQDFAHKTSFALAQDPATLLIAVEDLGVKRMTAAPKARRKVSGWARNGAAAKAGLNAAILRSAWGAVKTYAQYKAARRGKLVVAVPPAHSSQECSQCGHTHPDNRPSQAEFVCQSCGHKDNADANASKIIRQRGVRIVLSGERSKKPAKRIMRMRSKKQLGLEQSEVTPVETNISRESAKDFPHPSLKQETPPTPGTG